MDKLALIKKFIENRCTAEEAETAARLLEEDPELLEEVISFNDFESVDDNAIHPVKEAEIRKTVWKATIRRPYYILRNVVAAAAIITGLFFTGQYLIKPSEDSGIIAETVNTTVPAESEKMVFHFNDKQSVKRILLDDNSEVELYPGSAIRYAKNFSSDRKIHLEGIAIFNVRKNTESPFTVYTGSVSTTALGTKFLVKSIDGAGSVNVQLYEGKVVVEPSGHELNFERTFLSPGQQCIVDLMLSIVEVNNLPDEKYYAGRNAVITEAEEKIEEPGKLIFVKAPLATVLDSLQKIYNTKIEFNTEDIAESNFTGVLSLDDSLGISLRAIASMQGYEISTLESGFQFIIKEEPDVKMPEQQVNIERLKAFHHNFPAINFEPDYVYRFLVEEKPVVEITESGYRYNNISLSSLFEQLNKESGWEIVYDINEIEGMNFSGTLDYRQSVNNILNVICLVNDLEFTQKKRKYIITRKANK